MTTQNIETPNVTINDTLYAKDFSCTFTVSEFTKVGINGILTLPDGSRVEGSIMWHQLSDFSTTPNKPTANNPHIILTFK